MKSAEGNTFSQDSAGYARARPRYPVELYSWVVSHCHALQAAWDCGTGSGQAAVELAAHFDVVYGTDISDEQLANAQRRDNIVYSVCAAEESGLSSDSVDLVTVAQALHWFHFESFWPEVKRVARQEAFFCAWGYDWLSTTSPLDRALVEPIRSALEPFWAPNNRILWEGYLDTDIKFPFRRIESPRFEIVEHWSLGQLVQYFTTWSAFKRSRSDAEATNAIDVAVRRARELVRGNELLPIRMPLKVVAGVIVD